MVLKRKLHLHVLCATVVFSNVGVSDCFVDRSLIVSRAYCTWSYHKGIHLLQCLNSVADNLFSLFNLYILFNFLSQICKIFLIYQSIYKSLSFVWVQDKIPAFVSLWQPSPFIPVSPYSVPGTSSFFLEFCSLLYSVYWQSSSRQEFASLRLVYTVDYIVLFL